MAGYCFICTAYEKLKAPRRIGGLLVNYILKVLIFNTGLGF